MADSEGRDLFSSLSSEVLSMILSYMPAKTLLNLSETCRRLKELCLNCDSLWKRLCKTDYNANLLVKGNFHSFYVLYQLLYKCRIILEDTDYCTYSGYLPDWLYYWSALSTKPPLLGFFSLPAGRTKKTWGLTDEDLANFHNNKNSSKTREIKLERYYSWTDGMKAALCKHGSQKRFQEVALKRCGRSQKQIHKNFPKAVRSQRKRAFNRFQSEHLGMKDVLIKLKGNTDHLCFSKPQKIGQDYIEGLLHKTGMKQLHSYVEFVRQLQQDCSRTPQLFKDIPKCVSFVYEKLSSVAYMRYILPEEFMEHAKEYFGRVEEVWEWQCEKGIEYQGCFRDCKVVKMHQAYKDYVQNGNEYDFEALKLHFEGLENLKVWLDGNRWITRLLDANMIHILEGVRAENTSKDPDSQGLKRLVKRYLKTGRSEDFDKILKKLCDMANDFLQFHRAHITELENSLSVPPARDDPKS